MMTTSEYLKAQADLLIALTNLRRLRLGEFCETARAVEMRGGVLVDGRGAQVATDAARMQRIAAAAESFVAEGLRETA